MKFEQVTGSKSLIDDGRVGNLTVGSLFVGRGKIYVSKPSQSFLRMYFVSYKIFDDRKDTFF